MLGFDLRLEKEKNENQNAEEIKPETTEVVPTVVEVKFEDGRQYPYYNDKFDLKVDDIVFVDGKLQGKPGRVVSVTDKFKINLEYYKKVLSVLDLTIHGSFRKELWYMVTEGETNLTFEQVKSWFIPPEEKEEAFIKGKGDSADLEKGFPVSEKELSVAEKIVKDERCLFISVRDGEGRALIKGENNYHILEFNLSDGVAITDAYCDCIKPCSCCHMEAVSMLLFFLGSNGKLDLKKNFTIISANLFYNIVTFNGATITV